MNPTQLAPAKREVLRSRGKPDFMHILWSPIDEIVDKTTWIEIVSSPEENRKGTREATWVYISQGEEIFFPLSGTFRVEPLGDKLRVVCRLGDPQRVELLPSSRNPGERTEKWTYYNRGYIFLFTDGVLVEEQQIPALPHFQTP